MSGLEQTRLIESLSDYSLSGLIESLYEDKEEGFANADRLLSICLAERRLRELKLDESDYVRAVRADALEARVYALPDAVDCVWEVIPFKF